MRCTLMHKTVPVADMTVDDTLGVILSIGKLHSEAHLPVGVTATNGLPDHSKLTRWWASRSIPRKRSGLRPALERLNIPVALALAKESNGLSLSDQYWIRPENSEFRWESINFFDNGFSGDVGNLLFGEKFAGTNLNLLSPDSTTDGQLKKRWKISGGKRHLIKGGSNPFHQEPLNEAIASAVCRRLGIPHVGYELMWDGETPYCVCEDFIGPETELVTAYQICETKPFTAGSSVPSS